MADLMTEVKETEIIIADDHGILRAGLRAILEKEPEFKIIAEAKDGLELIEALQDLKPDLLILDLNMPHRDGLDVLDFIREGCFACPCLTHN